MNLCDVRIVKDIMSMFSLSFRKEFGQNFLINKGVVEDIAEGCCEDSESAVLEIGPGIGTLTRELAARYKEVAAIEIDKRLIPVLRYTLGDFHNVKIVEGDVLKTDIAALTEPYFRKGKVSVCANLPYYITTPIIMMLLESGLAFDYITVMIQSEVADRLCAAPGDKSYGAITASLNYYGECRRILKVSAGNFLPPPKVDSAVVRIKLHKEKPYNPASEYLFFKTIRAAFEQRRKTLPNALSAVFSELTKEKITEIVTGCGFSPNIRGERLGCEDYVLLSDRLGEEIERGKTV